MEADPSWVEPMFNYVRQVELYHKEVLIKLVFTIRMNLRFPERGKQV